MPKRKVGSIESAVIEELENIEDFVSSKENLSNNVEDEVSKKRAELVRLSEEGETTHSVSYIKKASAKVISRLYDECEAKRVEKANQFLTDLLISKFSDLLGGLDAVDDSKTLEKELQNDKLLTRDVESIVSTVTPYLPFLGLLSWGITTAKHVYQRKAKSVDDTVSEQTEVEEIK